MKKRRIIIPVLLMVGGFFILMLGGSLNIGIISGLGVISMLAGWIVLIVFEIKNV